MPRGEAVAYAWEVDQRPYAPLQSAGQIALRAVEGVRPLHGREVPAVSMVYRGDVALLRGAQQRKSDGQYPYDRIAVSQLAAYRGADVFQFEASPIDREAAPPKKFLISALDGIQYLVTARTGYHTCDTPVSVAAPERTPPEHRLAIRLLDLNAGTPDSALALRHISRHELYRSQAAGQYGLPQPEAERVFLYMVGA